MGVLDWLKQTWDQSAPDWLKQGATGLSNGISWLNQNVVQPSANWVKDNIGGSIGDLAGAIGQGANAVDSINSKIRKGDTNLDKYVDDIKNIRSAVGSGMSAAAGIKPQLKSKYNDVAGNINTILPSSKRLKTY